MTTHLSTPSCLVLGATGAIGYALTKELLSRKFAVTVLARDPAKARRLFGPAEGLEILKGDALSAPEVLAAAQGKQLVVHAVNYPYHQWEQYMKPVTQNILDAASAEGATLLFPGNVYAYGNATQPIRETDAPHPTTQKGRLRLQLEQQLEAATQAGALRVVNVRLPDFWGPNVTNAGFAPIFEGALQKKAMPWLVNADIPHQLAYTPDAARFMVEAALAPLPGAYTVLNYASQTVPSMRHWFHQVAQVAGGAAQVRVYPKVLFRVLGWFQPVMRELEEMLYLFEHTVVLDDSLRRQQFPHFRETDPEEAIRTTLAWFAENRLKSGKQAQNSRPIQIATA
ncbi:NAD-dependent epimerase/dehydratase family protein [Rufibacter psychrotolerans]|uniref:NAD-dependent epimerase/dehydratase family protein n=1 Tax=Rufibacter psychrotolerans TaxID=2812556 RepID=UPI0019682FE8|nr:NAD-dependent epimerase/dehydratase family protein [Rufibacter sp. SYSU D00308]